MNVDIKLIFLCYGLILSLNTCLPDCPSCGQQLIPGGLPNCFRSFLSPLNEIDEDSDLTCKDLSQVHLHFWNDKNWTRSAGKWLTVIKHLSFALLFLL